jgi:hypothetical protein
VNPCASRPARMNAAAAAAVLLVTLAAAPGCQRMIYRSTGDVMGSYAVDHMVPEMMASDDLAMACETGVSMGGFLMSFGRVTRAPDKAALVTLLSAGMCAEAEAWEADLRQVRALRDGRAAEARDARIAAQRAHAVAAARFHGAFQRLTAAYGPPGEICPRLADDDEVLYLLGLSAGMLAMVHDRAAEGTAGVPTDIPLAVSRASACLDDGRWWGTPLALRASVWAMVPGAAGEGDDPWATLSEAAATGEAAGVRLARAFQVQTLAAAGHDDALREAIAAHGASTEATPSDPAWKLLDGYASRMILHVSDRTWTRERGHRTPLGAFGTFWQPAPEPDAGDDDLFDDLLDDLDPAEDDDAPTEKENEA